MSTLHLIHGVLIWLILAFSSHASAIQVYTFSAAGDEQLFGAFALDDSAEWQLTHNGSYVYPGINGILQSPVQWIGGTYGDFVFGGSAELHTFDQPPYDPTSPLGPIPDHWIVRGQVRSQELHDRWIERINLFIYPFQNATTLSLDPPQLATITSINFQYTIAFNDGSYVYGPLASLGPVGAPVPEPGSIAMLAASLLAVSVARAVSRRRGGRAYET
jgi:hypothetical protein